MIAQYLFDDSSVVPGRSLSSVSPHMIVRSSCENSGVVPDISSYLCPPTITQSSNNYFSYHFLSISIDLFLIILVELLRAPRISIIVYPKSCNYQR